MSGFPAEFGGEVGLRTVSVDTAEGRTAVKRYGFRTHGLVLLGPAGELRYKRADHAVSPGELHQVLLGLLRPGAADAAARPDAAPVPAPRDLPAGPLLIYQ